MASPIFLALDIATATGYASGPARGRPAFGTWTLGKRGTTLGEKGAEFMRLLSARIIAEPPAILVIEAPLNIRVLLNIGTKDRRSRSLYGLVFLARTIALVRGVPEVRAVAVQSVRQHFLGQATFRDGYDAAAQAQDPKPRDGEIRRGGALSADRLRRRERQRGRRGGALALRGGARLHRGGNALDAAVQGGGGMSAQEKITFNRDRKFDLQLEASLIRERELGKVFEHSLFDGSHALTIELKTETWQWEQTGNICIEYRQNDEPSGIAITEADCWVHELRRDGETLSI